MAHTASLIYERIALFLPLSDLVNFYFCDKYIQKSIDELVDINMAEILAIFNNYYKKRISIIDYMESYHVNNEDTVMLPLHYSRYIKDIVSICGDYFLVYEDIFPSQEGYVDRYHLLSEFENEIRKGDIKIMKAMPEI